MPEYTRIFTHCFFSSISFHLRQHEKTHAAKLQCNVCEKKLKNQKYLEIHLRTHGNPGQLPYACSICKKTCATGSALARHVKSHDKIKNK
jgi:KRAB domain-containing zinc finger protein